MLHSHINGTLPRLYWDPLRDFYFHEDSQDSVPWTPGCSQVEDENLRFQLRWEQDKGSGKECWVKQIMLLGLTSQEQTTKPLGNRRLQRSAIPCRLVQLSPAHCIYPNRPMGSGRHINLMSLLISFYSHVSYNRKNMKKSTHSLISLKPCRHMSVPFNSYY